MVTVPINDASTRNSYTATGGQTVFPYTFWIKDEDDLDVYQNGTLLTKTTHYTIDTVQATAGGNVTLVTGATASDTIVIAYTPAIERQSEFQTSGEFLAASLNLELSYLTSLMQYIDTQLSRKLGFADSDTTVATFSLPTPSASEVLGWDVAGTALTNYGFSNFPGTITITTSGLADGDLLYYSLGNTDYRNTSVMNNLITGSPARGDLLYIDASGDVELSGSGVTGDIFYRDANKDPTRLAIGTANQLLAVNSGATAPEWVSILDEDDMTSDSATDVASQQSIKAYVDAEVAGVASITEGTKQASTSGTTIDFTSIPAGTKRITICFQGVSHDGTSAYLVRIGDAGGVESSSYVSTVFGGIDGNATLVADTSTAGFMITDQAATAATDILHGAITLTRMEGSTFLWVCSGTIAYSNRACAWFTGGSKALSAELDRVQITSVSGDTFDAGAINIIYE